MLLSSIINRFVTPHMVVCKVKMKLFQELNSSGDPLLNTLIGEELSFGLINSLPQIKRQQFIYLLKMLQKINPVNSVIFKDDYSIENSYTFSGCVEKTFVHFLLKFGLI